MDKAFTAMRAVRAALRAEEKRAQRDPVRRWDLLLEKSRLFELALRELEQREEKERED